MVKRWLNFVLIKPIFFNGTHFLKGIGGYFEITLPLNPLKIPLTQEDRFFSKVIACLMQALLLFILKMLKHFLNSIKQS